MEHQVLLKIAKELNENRVTWGLGGSCLLAFYNLVQQPNDIDLLISEKDAVLTTRIFNTLGREYPLKSKEPYRTTYFYHYQVQDVEVDVMGGFAIKHDEGEYRLGFNQESISRYVEMESQTIPLSSLESWYIMYQLIPGRQHKADMIEEYFISTGNYDKGRLEQELNKELPTKVVVRVQRLIEQ